MPRTPDAQKAYNQARAATLAEAKDLENKGQHHLMTEAHVKALTTYRKSLDTRSSREKAAKEALVSGNTAQKIAPSLKKRVEERNPYSVGRLSAGPEMIQSVDKISESKPKVSDVLDYEKGRKTGTTNPINNDLSHFSSMYDLADKLDEKLLDSKLSAKNTNVKTAGGHLATFFDAHDAGLDAHLKGDAKAAAANMESMHKSLAAAHLSLDTFKQLKLNPKISEMSEKIKNSYVTSKIPGIGNKPHESFVPTATRKFKPSTVLDKPKNTGSLPKSTGLAGLADSFDALPGERSFGSSLGKQFTEQGGYKSGQQHMNDAVIGMMEGRG
jgi:hypothetical protein